MGNFYAAEGVQKKEETYEGQSTSGRGKYCLRLIYDEDDKEQDENETGEGGEFEFVAENSKVILFNRALAIRILKGRFSILDAGKIKLRLHSQTTKIWHLNSLNPLAEYMKDPIPNRWMYANLIHPTAKKDRPHSQGLLFTNVDVNEYCKLWPPDVRDTYEKVLSYLREWDYRPHYRENAVAPRRIESQHLEDMKERFENVKQDCKINEQMGQMHAELLEAVQRRQGRKEKISNEEENERLKERKEKIATRSKSKQMDQEMKKENEERKTEKKREEREEDKRDPVDCLPPEILWVIFSGMLEGRDIVSCMLVNKAWHRIASDERIPWLHQIRCLSADWDNLFTWRASFENEKGGKGISLQFWVLATEVGRDEQLLLSPTTINLSLTNVAYTNT